MEEKNPFLSTKDTSIEPNIPFKSETSNQKDEVVGVGRGYDDIPGSPCIFPRLYEHLIQLEKGAAVASQCCQ